jgi:large subunit ribosomal protein L4
MKTDIYNIKGDKVSSLDLPENIFSLDWNGDLVHQVIHSQMNNQRANTAHTKDRSEVRGGGKKPWQQKGLGRARHGSSRSPIWTGGGVTHGPRNERNYKQDVPKVMKNRALFTLLSEKLKSGKILFIDNIKIEDGKTKNAEIVMQNLQKVEGFKTINWKKHNNCIIYTAPVDRPTHLAFRNLENVRLENMDQMNPLTLANTRYIVLSSPSELISYLESKK